MLFLDTTLPEPIETHQDPFNKVLHEYKWAKISRRMQNATKTYTITGDFGTVELHQDPFCDPNNHN